MASTRPPLSTRKTASVHAMKRTSPHVESTTRKDKKRRRHTFDHDIDRIWKEKDRGQQHDNHRAPPKARTVVLHIERQWRIIVVYPTPVVQESMRACVSEPVFRPSEPKHKTEKKRRETHRILATSLPTLFAYALCNLSNFVFRLILKKTSSPVELTTCERARASVSRAYVRE